MAKQLLFGEEARQKLLKGAEILAKAITITLGPKSRNTTIERKWGTPNILHDGALISKEIELEDPFENTGAQLIREVAEKTVDKCGDGTTTSTLLAYEIFKEGMKHLAYGENPMVLKEGMDKALEFVIKKLKTLAKPIKTKQEIEQVATISSANPLIGKLVANALEKVGKEGVVTVEEGNGIDTEIEYKEGMQFDKGYISKYFVTNDEKMEAEVKNPYILITDYVISSNVELLPFFNLFVQNEKDIVIIAEDIVGEALSTLILNKVKGILNVVVIKAPSFADRKKDILEDIATLTGATVISKELGKKLENITMTDLGKADSALSDAETTKIIGGKGNKEKLKIRIDSIKNTITKSTSDFEKEKLKERLAKLASGVAVIKVGAATEIELKEKKERAVDAVEATKSAIEEGIVAGGGVTLLHILLDLHKFIKEEKNTSQQIGMSIVCNALRKPIEKLLENAGEKIDSIIDSIMVNDYPTGYDVKNGKFGDMYEMGIIDPAKVTRFALQNAVSVASMALTTECLITNIPEKEDPRQKLE